MLEVDTKSVVGEMIQCLRFAVKHCRKIKMPVCMWERERELEGGREGETKMTKCW